jgi:DNA-binding transcriptional ArsR family regulator
MKTIISDNSIIVRGGNGAVKKDALDYVAVSDAALTLRAVNHRLRQQIIKLLKENDRMNVTDIYSKLHLEQSVASQHLAILRRANIVITQRDGHLINYSLNPERIAAVAVFTDEMVHSSEKEVLENDEVLKRVKKNINDLRHLPENWDDEGASPIDKTEIQSALSFVDKQFRHTSIIPSFIAPTLESGVLIEFADQNKRIDIRFENHQPFMTIFESGKLLYKGNIDQTQFTRHFAG